MKSQVLLVRNMQVCEMCVTLCDSSELKRESCKTFTRSGGLHQNLGGTTVNVV
jgi:hypothetical protein